MYAAYRLLVSPEAHCTSVIFVSSCCLSKKQLDGYRIPPPMLEARAKAR